MKIYDKIFFVIDCKNYNKNKKDLFYGYKTVEDEGFWLNVKHLSDKIHIYSSAISPVIVIYKKDNYWAISNSCYFLAKFLKDKGINLTINNNFLELENKKYTSFSYNYESNILIYNDLFINDNNEEVEIIDGKLLLKNKHINYFNKNINRNLNILNIWYEKYKNYLKDKELTLNLSGGLDSRFLWYCFTKDNSNAKINSWYNKPNVNDNIDAELAAKVVKLYSDQILTPRHLKRNQNITSEPIKSYNMTESNKFLYGICYKPSFIDPNNPHNGLRIVGTGSNIFRYEFQDLNFLNGNIRRNWVTSFIAKYYLTHSIYVCPYLDSLLLELNTEETDYLHVILYSMFAEDLLNDNIPFITKSKNGVYNFKELRNNLFIKYKFTIKGEIKNEISY